MKDLNGNTYQLSSVQFLDKIMTENLNVNTEQERAYITSNNVNELKKVINSNATITDEFGNNVTSALIVISGLIGSENFDELLSMVAYDQNLLRQL